MTIKTKYYAYPEPRTAQILGGASSTAYNAALDFAAQALYVQQQQLEKHITPKGWAFLSDVLNGTVTDGRWNAAMLVAEIEDARRLDGKTMDDEDVEKFVDLIRGCHHVTVQAILFTVRFFWENHDRINIKRDQWWTMEFRCRFVAANAKGAK